MQNDPEAKKALAFQCLCRIIDDFKSDESSRANPKVYNFLNVVTKYLTPTNQTVQNFLPAIKSMGEWNHNIELSFSNHHTAWLSNPEICEVIINYYKYCMLI